MIRPLFVCDGRFKESGEGRVNMPACTPPLPYADALAAAAELNRQRPTDHYWVRPEPVNG